MDLIKKIRKFALSHKVFTAGAVIVIIFIGYKLVGGKSANTEPRYLIAEAQIGTVVKTVSGSGQVSGSDQIEVKSKTSGQITSISTKTGEFVEKGALIATIDNKDALLSLQSANLALQKLTKPPSQTDLDLAKNSVIKAYNDGWNAATDVFSDLRSVIDQMKDMLYSNSGFFNEIKMIPYTSNNSTLRNLRNKAAITFDSAERAYNAAFTQYNSMSRLSESKSISDLINNTSEAANRIAEALKNYQNMALYISQNETDFDQSGIGTATTNINSWLATTNSLLSSVVSAANSIKESENRLNDLVEGPDELDVASQKISVAQKQEAYDNTFIRAPFSGTIAKIDVKTGDDVSGSAVIATLISKSKIAEISLSEIDVAGVKAGQKATLTFDAIPGLSLTGEVIEVELVGTESQGVINYNLKIGFDTQDERVRSGMSVTADIATDVKQDVLIVPNGAVKSSGSEHYVEMLDQSIPITANAQGVTSAQTPVRRSVEIGISDDRNTEIVSGLSVSEKIISRVISAQSTTAATAPSLFGGGGGGGNVRFSR